MTNPIKEEMTVTITDMQPIVEAHIGAHLAEQARTETRWGVQDAAGTVYEALGHADAESMLEEITCGPQPRRVVRWFVTTSPPMAYLPACTDELHGADGGACPGCGWDSHPIPAEPAGPWANPLPPVPATTYAVPGTHRGATVVPLPAEVA